MLQSLLASQSKPCPFVCVFLALAAPVAGRAEEARSSATTIESIFSGRPPRNVAELKLMQQRQREVAQMATARTIAVRVGPAQGSGVIISSDGYVLTAAHVAGRPGRRVLVFLPDGKQLIGKTLGLNRSMDAGLIKLPRPEGAPDDFRWPHAEMGDSSALKPGQWVMTLGHPDGYVENRPAVVRLGRVLSIKRTYIKTDCKLVGGDSGGPLFDMHGKVVGIHSRIGSSLVNNMHAPIDAFRQGWDRMAKSETWGLLPGTRPFIGVLGVRDAPVAKIRRVYPSTPAAAAGVEPGDVIVEFDGKPVTTFDSLRKLVRGKDPDETITMKVRRAETTIELRLTIAATDD